MKKRGAICFVALSRINGWMDSLPRTDARTDVLEYAQTHAKPDGSTNRGSAGHIIGRTLDKRTQGHTGRQMGAPGAQSNSGV